MDKLIVTIISIAMTAAILYGVSDYMTSFYTAAQARSKAQIWISEAAQIATAAQNAGYLASGSDNWSAGTATYLVPSQLASLPRHASTYVFQPAYTSAPGVSTVFPRNNTDATIIVSNGIESAAVCQEIQKIANRNNSALTNTTAVTVGPTTTVGSTVAKNATQRFMCVWHDTNANTAQDASPTDRYYFIYRVFLDRGSY